MNWLTISPVFIVPCYLEATEGAEHDEAPSSHRASGNLAERLAEEALRFKDAADQLPPGQQRELYLRRAQQAEAASQLFPLQGRRGRYWEISQVPFHVEAGKIEAAFRASLDKL